MSILPINRPRLEASRVKSLLALKCIRSKVTVVGIRGFSGPNKRNLYDDAIFIVSPRGFWSFNANTDPSKHKFGIASLKPGVYTYKPGMHGVTFNKEGYPYPAFVQADQVTVLRDDKPGEYKGWFGINIHRGGRDTTGSAGCQTIPPDQWMEFRKILEAELKAAHIVNFSYVLIDAKDLPQ